MWPGAEVINVAFLTEPERELILAVLQRDQELRRVEELRVRRLKAELLDIRRKGAKRSSQDYSRRACGRCQEPLGRLSVGSSRCRSCNHLVCRRCQVVRGGGGSWACSVCAKEGELKKSTGDWFYDQRVNRFMNAPGYDLVRASLRKRPPAKKRETVGEVLLQRSELNPSPRPRATDPQAVDKGLFPEISVPTKAREQQGSDAELLERGSLSSYQPEIHSSQASPVLQRRDSVQGPGPGASTLTVPTKPEEAKRSDPEPFSSSGVTADESDVLFKKNPRRTLKPPEYSRPTSVLDLRENALGVDGGSMGDRSKSVPGLNIQHHGDYTLLQEEEEEEDIDSLVEIHRKSAGSTYSLRSSGSRTTLGSMMSVYSEAGDYDSAEVSGEIVFSLSYDERTQTLCIFIKECQNLAHGDVTKQRSNPYVKCYLLPDMSRQSKRKTAIKRNTTNPSYNETLKYNITQSQLMMRSVQLSVWHYDRFGRNVFLGEVELPMDSRNFDTPLEECMPLCGKVKPENGGAYGQYKGELVISLKYVSPHKLPADKSRGKRKKEESGELHVLIKEAKNLNAMKSGGTSDSFVKGYLLPSRTKMTKRKTPVVKKTLNPHYDHTFVYKDLRLEELKNMCVELTVWDREAMSSNDFLGGVRLSTGTGLAKGEKVDWMDSRGEEVCLWQKMMQYPDSWAEGTLPLRSSMGKSQ